MSSLTGTRVLRSSAGRWPVDRNRDKLDLFPLGRGREEVLQLKELFLNEPVLPTVRPLTGKRPLTTPVRKNDSMTSVSTLGSEVAIDSENSAAAGGEFDGDGAEMVGDGRGRKPRGPLIAANSDVLTIASEDTKGSGAHEVKRPHTSCEDYVSLSNLTLQANRRANRILGGPRKVSSSWTSGSPSKGKSEWIPPGFEPKAVMDRVWDETCGMWEAAAQRYEVMISTVAPEKELLKLVAAQKEKQARKAELERESEKKQDDKNKRPANAGQARPKGTVWIPGEGYVTVGASTTTTVKTTPMGNAAVKRKSQARMDELRWSSDKRAELQSKVDEHWKVKKALSGASQYSFVK
jgi:hypothetical protein